MKIIDLKGIVYSSLGGFIQFVKLYRNGDFQNPICDGGTIEHVIENYPDEEVILLRSIDDCMVIVIK